MGDAEGERLVPERHLTDLVHDLRTPLTVVAGFAELLERRPDLPEEQRAEFLARIVEATREMSALLDDERDARRTRDPG